MMSIRITLAMVINMVMAMQPRKKVGWIKLKIDFKIKLLGYLVLS